MKTHLPYIIAIVVLSLFGFRQFSVNKQEGKRHEQNYKAQQDSTVHFKNKFNETVASKLAVQLTVKELKVIKKENKRLQEALKNFKKPIAVIQTKQVIKFDTIYIPFKNPIKCVFSEPIVYKDKWYSFNANASNEGFSMLSFDLVPNEQDIVFGWKKKSLFSKSELRVEITNSNELFNQEKIKPIIIHYERAWHEKPIYTVPIGVILGVLISK